MSSSNTVELGAPLDTGPSRPYVNLTHLASSCLFSSARRTGSWLPLPYIHTGFIVHPFLPTGQASSTSPKSPNFRNRFSWSGIHRAGQTEAAGATPDRGNIYELALDVGDEFFAFEEYKCTIEEDGKGDTWYRG